MGSVMMIALVDSGLSFVKGLALGSTLIEVLVAIVVLGIGRHWYFFSYATSVCCCGE